MIDNRPLILIVDKSLNELSSLYSSLSDDYNLIFTNSSKAAIDNITEYKTKIAVVLFNTSIKTDWINLLEKIHNFSLAQRITFIIFSDENDESLKLKSLELGAREYLVKPINKKIVKKLIEKAVVEYNKQQEFFNILVDQITQRDKRTTLLIYILSQILKQSNNESGEHIIHIRLITRIILETLLNISDKYYVSPEDISSISLASCLHDIGKVKISNDILNKPGKLTDEEFEEVKKHTIYGEELLNEYNEFKDDIVLKFAKEICRWHHEKWDGSGYPDGLIGDEIPLWSQAVAISDCYDALTSERCYKSAYSHEEAIRMILNDECGKFNEDIKKALVISADKIKNKLSEKNAIDLDTKQDAKRFADSIILQYRQYL